MIRIGQGVDVHPFDATRPLILGGVRISETNGLAGHSDADAVLHAITDAILGAAGAGDIGQYFPSTDERWRNADSRVFVAEARRVLEEMEAEITNIDVTIIAQQPKLSPHRDAMVASIAQLLDLPEGHVNVKATTTDHLGFIGRGEGICAMAILACVIPRECEGRWAGGAAMSAPSLPGSSLSLGMTTSVRVRFAPSPTGHLHVGGARTAIFNWLFARHHNGTFVIRVEDTDQARSTRESEEMVLEDLRWLGLAWDEGPYRQSERLDFYARLGRELLERGVAYRCYCSEEELEQKRKQAEIDGRPPHYDLKCWINRRDDDAPHAIRFHVPDDGDVTIDDLIRGEITWRKESLGDFILIRSDGFPIYNFCVVADDHDMRITHVIRAEEHLTNTHRQVLIYRAMGWDVPQFAHVSLILGQDRSKLSKRHGATSVNAYADDGYLSDAMFNYLTLLGWSSPDAKEVFTRDEAIANFSLDRVNPAPAVFDSQKLDWLNGQYIHAMSASDLAPLVRRFFDVPWLEEGIDVVKTSVHKLTQFADALRFVSEYTPPTIDLSFAEKLADELRANGTGDYHAMVERLKAATGLKGKALFMPLRLAITGLDHGPELVRAIPLLQHASEVDPRVLSPLSRVERCIA